MPTNLSDHDNALSLWVIDEPLEAINEICAIERVSADTNASCLSKTCFCGLIHGFVSESAGTAHNTNFAFRVDVPGHDAHLTLTRLDNSWTIWSNETGFTLARERMLDLYHVLLWDPLCDAHNQSDLGLKRLKDSSSS